MSRIELRADRAPYPAMLEAIRLIREITPVPEKLVEAEVVLQLAVNQLTYASAEMKRFCGVPE